MMGFIDHAQSEPLASDFAAAHQALHRSHDDAFLDRASCAALFQARHHAGDAGDLAFSLGQQLLAVSEDEGTLRQEIACKGGKHDGFTGSSGQGYEGRFDAPFVSPLGGSDRFGLVGPELQLSGRAVKRLARTAHTQPSSRPFMSENTKHDVMHPARLHSSPAGNEAGCACGPDGKEREASSHFLQERAGPGAGEIAVSPVVRARAGAVRKHPEFCWGSRVRVSNPPSSTPAIILPPRSKRRCVPLSLLVRPK
jgi:hypothetical protein